jgi:hypothetical protein
VQGCTTAVFAVLLILGGLALLIAVITLLTVMVGLFLAAPFGTLVYMAIYGFFNRGGASVTLSLLMALKVGFVLSLVMAQQRFLQNKGLILLILTSFAATMITGFFHGVVPLFLVSITDAIAAIIGHSFCCSGQCRRCSRPFVRIACNQFATRAPARQAQGPTLLEELQFDRVVRRRLRVIRLKAQCLLHL